jgi:4-diphosphocytidyl-2-C-methyl-D-erythritol kinase
MAERAIAPAKVNLDLRVLGHERDGYHRLRSLAQAIDRYDTLDVEPADEDALAVDGEEIEGPNLVWKAIGMLRHRSGNTMPLACTLHKAIPVAAGLGGGSADAAAALLAASRIIGGAPPAHDAVAIGADVPFFFRGGLAMMEGRGERLTALPFVSDYALAVVTPGFRLSTTDVFRTWDRLPERQARSVSSGSVPPSLREYAPLRNELEPAARLVAPDLGDWVTELETRWGRPALLTGSGPTLFGFFLDVDEAASAIEGVPGRAAFAAVPVPYGVRLDEQL